MIDPYRRTHRKIDPTQGKMLNDGTPNDDDRMEIGPTNLARLEWMNAGLEIPNLPTMREYRWKRLTEHIVERDYGGILLFDPLNIRYATDSTNMQVWNSHNPFRALWVGANGYMVLYDYANAMFLAEFNPLVKEIRTGASMFYFAAGDNDEQRSQKFAAEIAELTREHSGNNLRLAVDKILPHGLFELKNSGFDIMNGEEVTEKARSIKGPDEIKAMRCALLACENSVAEMEKAAIPGKSESEIWSVLHSENIRRGGEWIETRLLASGPRTNPWFQECGQRTVQNNEVLAFDTDLVGTYGICIDFSRTWWIGDGKPRDDMIYAMQHAHEHIMTNKELLKPGVSFKEITFGGHQLDEKYLKQKYGCKMHGVGLCDEWPSIAYPDNFQDAAFDYELQPGMVLCVEALVSEEGGDFSIKLEDQVLVTQTGYENITKYPFDKNLLPQ